MNLDHEMLCAAGLAAAYCSTEDGWLNLNEWAREKGILEDGEYMSRALMAQSSKAINVMVRQVEIELLRARADHISGGDET